MFHTSMGAIMKLDTKTILIWSSGFCAAIAGVHGLPFIVRHQVRVGDAWLSDTSAFWTTIVFAILAIVTWKLTKKAEVKG